MVRRCIGYPDATCESSHSFGKKGQNRTGKKRQYPTRGGGGGGGEGWGGGGGPAVVF